MPTVHYVSREYLEREYGIICPPRAGRGPPAPDLETLFRRHAAAAAAAAASSDAASDAASAYAYDVAPRILPPQAVRTKARRPHAEGGGTSDTHHHHHHHHRPSDSSASERVARDASAASSSSSSAEGTADENGGSVRGDRGGGGGFVRQQPAMEAGATIIDLRRASSRGRKARSRANETDAKREAEKIMVRERMARSRAKEKVEKRIRECEAEAGDGIDPPTTTTTTTGKTTTGTTVVPTPTTTTTTTGTTGAPSPTTTTTGPGVSVTFTPALNTSHIHDPDLGVIYRHEAGLDPTRTPQPQQRPSKTQVVGRDDHDASDFVREEGRIRRGEEERAIDRGSVVVGRKRKRDDPSPSNTHAKKGKLSDVALMALAALKIDDGGSSSDGGSHSRENISPTNVMDVPGDKSRNTTGKGARAEMLFDSTWEDPRGSGTAVVADIMGGPLQPIPDKQSNQGHLEDTETLIDEAHHDSLPGLEWHCNNAKPVTSAEISDHTLNDSVDHHKERGTIAEAGTNDNYTTREDVERSCLRPNNENERNQSLRDKLTHRRKLLAFVRQSRVAAEERIRNILHEESDTSSLIIPRDEVVGVESVGK